MGPPASVVEVSPEGWTCCGSELQVLFPWQHGNSLTLCPSLSSQEENPEHALCVDEACSMLTLREGTVDMLVSLLPVFPERKFSSVTTILPTGLVFPMPRQIMEQMVHW